MKHSRIVDIAVLLGFRVLLTLCTVLGLFLWAFKEWLGGIIWVLSLFTLFIGVLPTVKDRVRPLAMWAAGGFTCGGIIWWIIILNYVRG